MQKVWEDIREIDIVTNSKSTIKEKKFKVRDDLRFVFSLTRGEYSVLK
jgi:hypothetical protein